MPPVPIPASRFLRACALAALVPAAIAAAHAAPPCIRVERETPMALEVAWSVPSETVNALRGAYHRLAQAAGIQPHLSVCGSPEVNARAVDGRSAEIRIDVGLLRFTQNTDELAAVLAHEFAHLLMSHRAKKMEAVREAYDDAVQHGGTVRTFLESVTSFSRAAEREADDVGVKLAVKAGFSPFGARSFAQRMLQSGFAAGEGYLSTHPGLGERAWYSGRMAANENFHAKAEVQLESGDAAGLEKTVESWKVQAPDSGAAAYYGAFAAVLAHRSQAKVSSELEDAVGFFGIDDASVLGDEYRAQARDAMLSLCVSLHREGRVVQALNCVKRLRPDDVDAFRRITGWNAFLVLGRGYDGASSVYGAHLPGGPVTLSTCRRIVRDEGLRPSSPWRAMRAPRAASAGEEPAPALACDPGLCDCRATSLDRVSVAE